jgi:hypothetical protein
MLRDVFSMAYSNVLEYFAPNKYETVDDMVDGFFSDLQKEAVSGLDINKATAIFNDIHRKIFLDAKKKVVGQRPVKKYVTTEQLEELPDGWEMNWQMANREALSYFSKVDTMYLSKYLDKESLIPDFLKKTIKEKYIEAGVSPYDGKKALNALKESYAYTNAELNGKSDSYLRMMIQTAVARSQNIGTLTAMNAMGVKKYKVVGPSDGKTCWYCHSMLNREFDVAPDMEWANGIYMNSEEDKFDIKHYSISNRFHNNVSFLDTLTAGQVQAGGPAYPPYHPNCRHTIIPLFSPTGTPIKPPEPVAPPVVTPPGMKPSDPTIFSGTIDTSPDGIKRFLDNYDSESGELAKRVNRFTKVEHAISEGHFNITTYKDPDTGEVWMLKKSDYYTSHNEVAAYKIGQLLNPGSRVPVFTGDCIKNLGDGKITDGTLQRLIPYDLIESKQLTAVTTKANFEFLAREQLVDKMLGNFDTHNKNFITMKDGRIIAVDKGDAWSRPRFYVDSDTIGTMLPKLPPSDDYLRNSNSVYKQYYSQIKDLFKEKHKLPFDIYETLSPTLDRIDAVFDTKVVYGTAKFSPHLERIFGWRNNHRSVVTSAFDDGKQLLYKVFPQELKGLRNEVSDAYKEATGVTYKFKGKSKVKLPKESESQIPIKPTVSTELFPGVHYDHRTKMIYKDKVTWNSFRDFMKWFSEQTGVHPAMIDWGPMTTLKTNALFQDIAPFMKYMKKFDWSKLRELKLATADAFNKARVPDAGGICGPYSGGGVRAGDSRLWVRNSMSTEESSYYTNPVKRREYARSNIKSLARDIRFHKRHLSDPAVPVETRKRYMEVTYQRLIEATKRYRNRDLSLQRGDINGHTSSGYATNKMSGVLTHELGHAFHLQNHELLVNTFGNRIRWTDKFTMNVPFDLHTTTYSQTTLSEAFAEAFSLYISGHIHAVPRKFLDFFEEHLGLGLEKKIKAIEADIAKQKKRGLKHDKV